MAKALGVGGVFFRAGDNEKTAAWYQEHLGFEMHPQWGASFPPDQLPEGAMTVFSAFAPDTKYFDPSESPFMVNLIVDDIEGALAQVKAGGATQVDEIVDESYGRFAWFLDPEGRKIELWEPKVPPPEAAEGG